MKLITPLLALAISSLLLGCESSSSSNSGTEYSSNGDTQIESLTSDTSAIDPNINNGLFSISWTYSESPNGTYLSLYLSSNDTVSTGDAVIVDSELCILGCSSTTYSADCSFNTSNIFTCTGIGETDLTDYLPSLPFDGHLILQSCTGLFKEGCTTATTEIQLL